MFILIKLSFNLKDNLQHAKKSCIKRLSENGMHCCRKAMPASGFCDICCLCRQHQWLCTAEAASQKLWGEHVYRILVALYKRKELWLGAGEAAAQAKIQR